jgi:hypothetical protein
MRHHVPPRDKPLTNSPDATGFTGSIVGGVFALLFVAVGLGICAFGLHLVHKDRKARQWPMANCTIIDSQIVRQATGDYEWKVTYTYHWKARTYESKAFCWDVAGSDNYADEERLALAHPVGSMTTCYVDPANPASAILKQSSHLYLLIFAFGIPFAIGGFIALRAVLRGGRPRAPISPRLMTTRSTSGWGAASLLFIFATAGSLTLWFGFLHPWLQGREAARSWVKTPCRILTSHVRSHSGGKGPTYSVDILYSYQFGGREYKSNRYVMGSGSSSEYESKAQVVARNPPGRMALCFVNPADPLDAVLLPGLGISMAWMLLPLAFVLVGLGGLLGMAKRFAAGR